MALPCILFLAYKKKVDINIKAATERRNEMEKDNFEKASGLSQQECNKIAKKFEEENTRFCQLQDHVPPKLFLAYYAHVSLICPCSVLSFIIRIYRH